MNLRDELKEFEFLLSRMEYGEIWMKIKLNSVFVEDQEQALEFYTGVLGFVKKIDIPLGQFRWLTVVSPEEPEGTQLVLEPSENPARRRLKRRSSSRASR